MATYFYSVTDFLRAAGWQMVMRQGLRYMYIYIYIYIYAVSQAGVRQRYAPTIASHGPAEPPKMKFHKTNIKGKGK